MGRASTIVPRPTERSNMNATAMLLRKLHRIGELLAVLEAKPARRAGVMSDVIDEVMGYVALEEHVLLPIAEPALGPSARALRTTHVQARLALFRMAVSEAEDGVFVRGVTLLREAFRAHALALAGVLRSLEHVLSPPALPPLPHPLPPNTLP